MLTIYSTPESLYCSKLRILLRHKQAQWQEVSPEGGCGSQKYRDLIPSGTMPAMVDGDLVIADSEAIAEYLNEKIKQPAMLPETTVARAKCRERSRFHDTRLEPEVRALFPHIGPGPKNSDFITTQSDKLSNRLDEFSKLLETDNTLNLDCLTLADCGFPISFAWLEALTNPMGLNIVWPEVVRDYRTKIELHAAVADELSAYVPSVNSWIQSKEV
jgi:glutathione S-transferase/maleylpyruvate isomerase